MAGNPILSRLSSPAASPANNPMAQIQQLRQMAQMMRGQNPQHLVRSFAAQNPQFAEFLRQNQGKSPQQIAAERGIDMGLLQQILR